jgi:hypothetical protein
MKNTERAIDDLTVDRNDKQRIIQNSDRLMESFKITQEQQNALWLKFQQNADGAASFEEFKNRVQPAGLGSDSYILLRWCGMTLGIELDGYTHS